MQPLIVFVVWIESRSGVATPKKKHFNKELINFHSDARKVSREPQILQNGRRPILAGIWKKLKNRTQKGQSKGPSYKTYLIKIMVIFVTIFAPKETYLRSIITELEKSEQWPML